MSNRVPIAIAAFCGLLVAHHAFAGNVVAGSAWQTVDTDGDGIADRVDNAPYTFNADQADSDNDLLGDATDPYLFVTDGDHDNVLDGFDPQPTDPTKTFVQYGLGGPYTASIGQAFAVNLAPNISTYTGYDRLAISLDGTPQAITFFKYPGDTSIPLTGGAMGLTAGVHTIGVTSFYNVNSLNLSLESFATVIITPEPTTLVTLASVGLFALRRSRR